ncbi:uncharacterized protein LOC126896115 [Daktulosphaira vitifoliae]|uniref:uncharacterized protein LOC126896115 n=1 Tax=Daktulosphaira vitifoliae TaxID=58002 RepID=UPI0021AAE240|nr:uncharacterized protein LOC126896115 [Daktulosphaira vitifoliae]
MVKSTLRSIIILAIYCSFSNAIDWKKYPNGKLMKSEVIFSVPNNIILGEINGGNITDEQYHLAMKIRLYKLLYLLLHYSECTVESYNNVSSVKSTIISDSLKYYNVTIDYIIKFMKNYQIDISDLEHFSEKILNSDLSEELFFSFQEFLRRSLFEHMKNFNKKLSIETETDDFNNQLNESINSWKIFNNLYNEETNKYFPPNIKEDIECMYAMNYIDKIITTEYAFKPSPYMKQMKDLNVI